MSLDPNFFCQYAPCDNQNLLAELVAMASIQQFQKREIILEMGTQQKWFYLLKQGVACSYSLQSDGSEITDCIMAETGMPVMPSPEFDIPSPTYIEALTDCTLVLLKISDVQKKPNIIQDLQLSLTDIYQGLGTIIIKPNPHLGCCRLVTATNGFSRSIRGLSTGSPIRASHHFWACHQLRFHA